MYSVQCTLYTVPMMYSCLKNRYPQNLVYYDENVIVEWQHILRIKENKWLKGLIKKWMEDHVMDYIIFYVQVVQKFIWSKGSVFPLLPDTQPGRRGSRASTGSETQRRFLQSGRRSSRDSIGSDQGRRFLQSGRRSSRDSTGSDQDRRFIENQRKRSCTESSEDMDIQELAELDDEQVTICP